MSTPDLTLDAIAEADLGDAVTLALGPYDVGTDEWLAAWALLCRVSMRTEEGPDRRYFPRSCVAATRIGIEAARYFGVAVEPLPVWGFAMTADAYAWHLEHGLSETSPVGWSVALGGNGTGTVERRDGRRWYDGHLICRLTGRDRIADIAIDQANRPERGLHLARPVVLELADDFFGEHDPDRLAVFGSEHGAVLAYRRLYGPAARGYRGNDWTTDSPTRRAVIGESIRLLREVTR